MVFRNIPLFIHRSMVQSHDIIIIFVCVFLRVEIDVKVSMEENNEEKYIYFFLDNLVNLEYHSNHYLHANIILRIII